MAYLDIYVKSLKTASTNLFVFNQKEYNSFLHNLVFVEIQSGYERSF